MREALADKEDRQNLKSKMREKVLTCDIGDYYFT